MNKRLISRRAVMRTIGVLGLGATCAPAPVLAAVGLTDAKRTGSGYKVSETRFLMGTYVSITVVNQSRSMAEHGMALAFDEIERLCTIFDRHRSDTPVTHLNQTGSLKNADRELHHVVSQAKAYARLTHGAYDATILPVVNLLRTKAAPAGSMDISPAELREALALVDSESITVSGNDILLAKREMGITLDGLGKGYIVDRASEVLANNGLTNHLLNAGGDMRASGERGLGKPWTVAIEDPAGKGRYPAMVQLNDAAIATSGGYENHFDAQGKHHHVVDPRTALSPSQSVSVSVIASTAMKADALSTAAFVLPVQEGLRLVNKAQACECLMVGKSGAEAKSAQWDHHTIS